MRTLAPVLVALLASACSRPTPDDTPVVRVAVAANFAATFDDLARTFEATQHVRVETSIGSTGGLFAQIENGAPFDLFLAADRERPARLAASGRALEVRTYAVGRLALVGDALHGLKPSDDARADLAAALSDPGVDVLAIANPDTAPYGAAALGVLDALGVRERFEGSLARGVDVGQTHQFAVTGAADLAFVALAQARSRPGEPYLEVPADLHTAVRQDAALLADRAAARRLLEFLSTTEAKAVLERAGYGSGAPD